MTDAYFVWVMGKRPWIAFRHAHIDDALSAANAVYRQHRGRVAVEVRRGNEFVWRKR